MILGLSIFLRYFTQIIDTVLFNQYIIILLFATKLLKLLHFRDTIYYNVVNIHTKSVFLLRIK
nr:MAG TPA: hypothetical protein [Caudoviricetes sp.]